MTETLLDASVLLALVQDEPLDYDLLYERIERGGTLLSAVNLAEFAQHARAFGWSDQQFHDLLNGAQIAVVPLVDGLALLAAELAPVGRALGLSLADRCCIATGIAFDAEILTTDRAWLDLPKPLAQRIRCVRPA